MTALVPELVNMASTPNVSTTDLLRRALVVASRLDVPELKDWIDSELNGYKSEEVPEYRRLHGQLVAETPRGTLPLLTTPEMTEMLTDAPVHQSIPELAHLQRHATDIFSRFPADIEQTLIRMARKNSGTAIRPVLKFSTVQIEGVIETARNRILAWALDLEKRGIIGEGMSFTPKEKQAVQKLHYDIHHVSGQVLIGSSGSTQTQANTMAISIEDLKELVQALEAMLADVKGDTADELRAKLATLKAQADSPDPKWEIIRATGRSIKTVMESAMGNILAGLAQPHMATLLALAGPAMGC